MKITAEQKERILKLDPNFFKLKMEVGKWYKDFNSKIIYFPLEIKDEMNVNAYGFDCNGDYRENSNDYEWGTPSEFREATETEVFEALKNEALRRYKKGIYIKGLCLGKISLLSFQDTGRGQGILHLDPFNCLWMNVGNARNEKVFENGVWAEIIPTIKKEEAELILNKKIA